MSSPDSQLGPSRDADSALKELMEWLSKHLPERDSAARLLEKLPREHPAQSVASTPEKASLWERAGLAYLHARRYHEALAIFFKFYDQMLLGQQEIGRRVLKALPLFWIGKCYSEMQCPVLAKRYRMLNLCEDAVNDKGELLPHLTGSYYPLVWEHGLAEDELREYSAQIYKLFEDNPRDGIFPEAILQELGDSWLTGFPSAKEATTYTVNARYIQHLRSKLGDGTGKGLEQLAHYLLSCMPGCKATRGQKTLSSELDITCSMEGFDLDFRSELGRYFVCECKDSKRRASFTTMAKFCRVLDSVKSRFGILFSMKGISGQGKSLHAAREQTKVYQHRGIVIVVVDAQDIEAVGKGANFINILRAKYEKVRLDFGRKKGED